MPSDSNTLLDALIASLGFVDAVPTDAGSYRSLSDAQFVDASRLSARLQNAAQTVGALMAGEVAHRSRSELGSSGLAQRSGYRTPEEMIRVISGVTAREAFTAVRVGRLAHDAAGIADPETGEIPIPARSWLASVGRAVSTGEIPVSAADAISGGLGSPSLNVTESELAAAAVQLCVEAQNLDPDRLLRRAHELRDELDEVGIAEREASRRDERGLTIHQRPGGMARLIWNMDPETAATVVSLYSRATSPRLTAPRMVDLNLAEGSTGAVHGEGGDGGVAVAAFVDDRLRHQRASDVFLGLLRKGSDADSSQLLGTGAPSVRVLVTEESLRARQGHGFFEGQTTPVSIETVERLACTGSMILITFGSNGQPLDLDREQRLYSGKQQIGLAARDGGCIALDCEQPPSECEAHHIEHWQRDNGKTNIADGVLLCRHHHLLFHNHGWEIKRTGSTYTLIPPASVDPQQIPRPMPSKSPAYRQLMSQRAG